MTDLLFPYQIDGAEFLAAKSLALLADEMGLGKSAQAIRGCDLVGATKICVVAPAGALINWEREFEEWSITERSTYRVTSRKPDPRAVATADVVACSYGLVAQLVPLIAAAGIKFDTLILDESHFLKGTETAQSRNVLGRVGLVRHTKRIWALSGTPAPNNVSELWPLLYTFGAYKRSFEDFIAEFCLTRVVHPQRPPKVTGTRPGTEPKLRALLADVMLRRRKKEVMKQLPPIKYDRLFVEAGEVDLEIEPSFAKYMFGNRQDELLDKLAQERAALEAVVGAAMEDHRKPGVAVAEAIMGMADSLSTIRRFTGLQKVDAIARLIIEELESKAYDKIVVFAIHLDVIEGLRKRLAAHPYYRRFGYTKDYNPVTVYGGTDIESRQKKIDRFQKDSRTHVFIGQIKACGTAITLTRAHQVLFVEQSWVPGDNAQAAMRVHRIGQQHPVTCRFASIANSIDEKVTEALRKKTADLQRIFDHDRETELTKTRRVSKTDTQDLAGNGGSTLETTGAGEDVAAELAALMGDKTNVV